MRYCTACGGRWVPGEGHVCDEAGVEAIKRNPLLLLLMDADGYPDRDAPVILGGGAVSSGSTTTPVPEAWKRASLDAYNQIMAIRDRS